MEQTEQRSDAEGATTPRLDEAWNPLDPFPSSPWFYLTWISVYAIWGLSSIALYFTLSPQSVVELLINTVAAFAVAAILGAVATLIGCRLAEKMTWRESLRVSVSAPPASVGIVFAVIAGI